MIVEMLALAPAREEVSMECHARIVRGMWMSSYTCQSVTCCDMFLGSVSWYYVHDLVSIYTNMH